MKERVLTKKGKNKVILVAPHGYEDKHTGTLVEVAANNLDCYAIINYGFLKSDYVDVENDLANCSLINHINQPVVYEEFLKPIIKIRDKFSQRSIKKRNCQEAEILIIYICGCEPHETDASMIIGYGLGTHKNSITCSSQKRNAFLSYSREIYKKYSWGEVHEGNNQFAGRNANHINQYFVKHNNDMNVDSLLIHFPGLSESLAVSTGIMLSVALDKMINRFYV